MMAGFAGHAVFPSIYRDMQDPKMYDRMVDITYVITFLVYVAMAAAGYLMFGTTTMQEASCYTNRPGKPPRKNSILKNAFRLHKT